jgi:hypothetical protein
MLTGDVKAKGKDLPMAWMKSLSEGVAQFGYSDIGLPMCLQESCHSAEYINATSYGTFTKDLSIVIGHKFLPSVLSKYLPQLGTSWARFGESRRRSQTARWWVDELKKVTLTDSPFVTVAHSLITHHPWTYDGFSGSFINPQTNYSTHHFFPATCDDAINFGNYLCTDEIMKLNKRIYGVNIRAADEMIAEVVSVLEENGKYDSTMIVVTADHGFAFAKNKDGRRIAPSDVYWQDLVKVPLFVKYPNQKQGEVVTGLRSTDQILSSVLHELNLAPKSNISSSLLEESNIQTVDGNPQNLEFPTASQLNTDRGIIGQAENPSYLYALGPAAKIMGKSKDSVIGSISPVTDATMFVDRHRNTPSPSDQQYRHLVGGFLNTEICLEGYLVLVDENILIGTAHSYPSFQQPGKIGFWGVVQSSEPISNPQLHCFK